MVQEGPDKTTDDISTKGQNEKKTHKERGLHTEGLHKASRHGPDRNSEGHRNGCACHKWIVGSSHEWPHGHHKANEACQDGVAHQDRPVIGSDGRRNREQLQCGTEFVSGNPRVHGPGHKVDQVRQESELRKESSNRKNDSVTEKTKFSNVNMVAREMCPCKMPMMCQTLESSHHRQENSRVAAASVRDGRFEWSREQPRVPRLMD